MNISPEDIERRIKRAGDKYVDDQIDADELEERIERALSMTYSYEELVMCNEFLRASDGEHGAMIFGREIEPGEAMCFDDMFDVDPLDRDVCPY